MCYESRLAFCEISIIMQYYVITINRDGIILTKLIFKRSRIRFSAAFFVCEFHFSDDLGILPLTPQPLRTRSCLCLTTTKYQQRLSGFHGVVFWKDLHSSTSISKGLAFLRLLRFFKMSDSLFCIECKGNNTRRGDLNIVQVSICWRV